MWGLTLIWTVHHLDSWTKRDQLDVTCSFISLFTAQHVSDVNTSETCWALNNEIKKQVTSSWSLFNYQDDAQSNKHKIHSNTCNCICVCMRFCMYLSDDDLVHAETCRRDVSDQWLFITDCAVRWIKYYISRSQWPRGIRRRSEAARLLRLWVRISPGT